MSSSTLFNQPRANWKLFAPSARCLGGLPRYAWLTPWLAALMLLAARLATAQEALRSSLAGDAAAEARNLQLQSLPYTVKSGDFRLLVTPSLELDWNDNINLSRNNAEADFILRPLIALNASYPIGTYNLLNLSVAFGYDKYLNHDAYSQWRLNSGSELSFDVYVKDFWINFHDRFQYSQDPSQEAAVAGTGSGSYGTFQNTAGLSGTWDLEDVTLTLGYDHQNTRSLSSQFNQMNNSSELVVARAGLLVHPRVTVGVEGTASFMTYDQAVLNDNQQYSAGIYGDWRPGSYFSVQPRVGYTIFESGQTSSSVKGGNLASWYANLTLAHQVTDFLRYSLSAGHEIRAGIQSDAIEVSYIRPSVDWKVIKDVTLQTSLFYEHGAEGGGQQASLLEKNYDQYGGGLNLSYSLTKKVRISLNYRLTLRSSNVASREYTQNLVGLQMTYTPQTSQ
jgi:Putative beta-barrel porin 2